MEWSAAVKGDVTSRTLATGDGCDEHKDEFYEAPVRILPGRIFFFFYIY